MPNKLEDVCETKDLSKKAENAATKNDKSDKENADGTDKEKGKGANGIIAMKRGSPSPTGPAKRSRRAASDNDEDEITPVHTPRADEDEITPAPSAGGSPSSSKPSSPAASRRRRIQYSDARPEETLAPAAPASVFRRSDARDTGALNRHAAPPRRQYYERAVQGKKGKPAKKKSKFFLR